MRIATVTMDGAGGSRFDELDLPQVEAPYAQNVAPLLVSTPLPAAALVFVSTPPEAEDGTFETAPHPAPRRQILVMVEGAIEVETSDGQRQTFGPGRPLLVEDTEGSGHISRAIGGRATFMAVPLS